jgi:hypothetical protein
MYKETYLKISAPFPIHKEFCRRKIKQQGEQATRDPWLSHELISKPMGVKIVPVMEEEWIACLQTLEVHNCEIISVAFSHDSTWLAPGTKNQTTKSLNQLEDKEQRAIENHIIVMLEVEASPCNASPCIIPWTYACPTMLW